MVNLVRTVHRLVIHETPYPSGSDGLRVLSLGTGGIRLHPNIQRKLTPVKALALS